jgi:hypothetical protein
MLKLLKSWQALPHYTRPKAQTGMTKSAQPTDRVPRQPLMNDWLRFSDVAKTAPTTIWGR